MNKSSKDSRGMRRQGDLKIREIHEPHVVGCHAGCTEEKKRENYLCPNKLAVLGERRRMNTDYLIFLGLYLFSLVIRTGYELLKKAHRVNPKNTMVFAVILVVMCVM